MRHIHKYSDFCKIYEFKYNNLNDMKTKTKELIANNEISKDIVHKISFIVRKTPAIIYNFLLYYLELKKINVDIDDIYTQLGGLYSEALSKKDLFEFSIDTDFTIYDTIEKLTDTLDRIKMDGLARKFLSNLPTELIKDIRDNYFDEFRNMLLDFNSEKYYSHYKDFVKKNIRSVDNARTFLDILKDEINNTVSGNDILYAKLKSPEGKKIKLLVDTIKIIVMEVFSAEDIDLVGTRNWCISTTRNKFSEYVYGGRKQFVIYDLNKPKTDIRSMIGVTVDADGIITDSHLKNDDDASFWEVYKLIYDNKITNIIKFSSNYIESLGGVLFAKEVMGMEVKIGVIGDYIKTYDDIKLAFTKKILDEHAMRTLITSKNLTEMDRNYDNLVDFLLWAKQNELLDLNEIKLKNITKSITDINILINNNIIDSSYVSDKLESDIFISYIKNIDDLKLSITKKYINFEKIKYSFNDKKMNVNNLVNYISDPIKKREKIYEFLEFCKKRNILYQLFDVEKMSIINFGSGGIKFWKTLYEKEFFTASDVVNMILNTDYNRGDILVDGREILQSIVSIFINNDLISPPFFKNLFSKLSIYDISSSADELTAFVKLLVDKNIIQYCQPDPLLRNNKYIFNKSLPVLKNNINIKKELSSDTIKIADSIDSSIKIIPKK